MTLTASCVTVIAGQSPILRDVTLETHPGTLTAVIGPNGAGKSTLMRVLSGEIVPARGDVEMNGKRLSRWSATDRARQRAVLPQSPTVSFPMRVHDVVELGRFPHQGFQTAAQSSEAIAGALAAADVTHLADRDCTSLSGGEAHRVHFARVLAQLWWPLPDRKTRHLLLDEPTASLDLAHQGKVLEQARIFAESGGAVLAILHDLNLAAAFADRLIVLCGGELRADGAPARILTPALIRDVWGVEARVEGDDPVIVSISYRGHNAQNRRELRAAE